VHRWLIDPVSVLWTADGGIDGQTPVDLDKLDLICIAPLLHATDQHVLNCRD
jgi:hypothetical protein